MTQIVESVYSKVIFLIASDWCSPIIVSNVFLYLILKACVRYFLSNLFFHQMIALQKLTSVFYFV